MKNLRVGFKKFKIKLFKILNRDYDVRITKEERCAMIIVSKLLENKSNELLMHPSGNKFYIKSEQTENSGIFVVGRTDPNEVNIINHKYSYVVRLSDRAFGSIYGKFIAEVEERRSEMEREFTKNIQHSLMDVAKGLCAKEDCENIEQ